MIKLKLFYDDEAMVAEVKKFLFDHLDRLALDRVYNKEGTEGIADAKEAILEAFKQLEDEFGKDDKKPNINSSR